MENKRKSADTFAKLLSEAIHRIRLQESKTVRTVQDELGYALDRQGGSAIERWRKGYLPPNVEDVEQLARIFVKRAGFEQEWILTFLQSAGYPHADTLCLQLFPTEANEAGDLLLPQKTPIEPAILNRKWPVHPSLMAGLSILSILGMVGVVALVFAWISPIPMAAIPTAAPLPAFRPETYRVLLLAPVADRQAQDLLVVTQGAFQSLLAQTGLSSQVDSQTYAFTDSQRIARMQQQSAVDTAVTITIFSGQAPHSVQLAYLLSESEPGVQAIAGALSEPFGDNSALDVGDQIATRLAVVVNADMGLAALKNGEHEACSRRFHAVQALTKQLGDAFSRHDVTHVTLGVCLDALGQAEVARNQYETALSLNPGLARAHYGLGNYWYVHRDFAQSRQYYEEAILLTAVDPLASTEVLGHAHAALGNIALAENRTEDAVTAFNKAIAYDETHPAYYLARATAFIALQYPAKAAKDLNQCMALVSSLSEAPSAYWQQLASDCETRLQDLHSPTLAATAVSLTPLPSTIQATATRILPPGTSTPGTPIIPSVPPTIAATPTQSP